MVPIYDPSSVVAVAPQSRLFFLAVMPTCLFSSTCLFLALSSTLMSKLTFFSQQLFVAAVHNNSFDINF